MCLLCNKVATFSFLDKVFGAAHSPPRRGGVSATSKTMDPFRFVADGVVSSARLRRPAELTTNTASRYRVRASRPSAPPLWLRGVFLMAQPPLLCEEGNMTHSSSVQTATSLTFGCGAAALSLLWSDSRFLVQRRGERETFTTSSRPGNRGCCPTDTWRPRTPCA